MHTAISLGAGTRDTTTDHNLSEELESRMLTVLKPRSPDVDSSPLSSALFNDWPDKVSLTAVMDPEVIRGHCSS